jgi:acetyl-CoA synthetase
VTFVSGRRIDPAEVKSALLAQPKMVEAAVLDDPHVAKGQGSYAYVTLMPGLEPTKGLRRYVVKWIRVWIGPTALPELIRWAAGRPKTRSGKIMRRRLRKFVEDASAALRDISTLAELSV